MGKVADVDIVETTTQIHIAQQFPFALGIRRRLVQLDYCYDDLLANELLQKLLLEQGFVPLALYRNGLHKRFFFKIRIFAELGYFCSRHNIGVDTMPAFSKGGPVGSNPHLRYTSCA